MESSFIPLEPYFEHRNYLPAFGVFFALSYFVWTTRLDIGKYLKAGLALYLVAFALVTEQNVDVWTSKAAIGETWASDHPLSVRAQQMRADAWSRAGKGHKALEILGHIAKLRPDAMGPQVQYLLAACRAEPKRIDEYLKQVEARIPKARFDHAVIPSLITLKDSYKEKCPKLTPDEILGLVDIILKQDSVSIRGGAVSDLLYVKATVLAGQGKLQDAVSHLYAAFKERPSYDLGLASVEYLYNLGQYQEALKALDDVEAIHVKPWRSDNFRGKEIEQWRHKILVKLNQ
jgi:tetratricopeptide (TPR) repeat protein